MTTGKWATFSDDGLYRYILGRRWDTTKSSVTFIGLNPSIADDTIDDPTIRRCIGFATAWGFGGLRMVNLFAWRSTNPDALADVVDPVGPDNDEVLAHLDDYSALIVAAWGAHPMAIDRAALVAPILPSFTVLGLTAGGHPRHPLYMRKTCVPLDPSTLSAVA